LVNIVVTPWLLAPLDLEIGGWRAGAIKLLFSKLNSASCRRRRQAESSKGVANIPGKVEGLEQHFVASPRIATCTPSGMPAWARGLVRLPA
jgi:hypothetical protein